MAFELHEVLDTVRMTESEYFDIRAVTLGLSLLDCASTLPQTVCARVYDKVRRLAGRYVAIAEGVEQRYGVRIANKRISVTPVTLVAGGLQEADYVRLATILDAAAADVGVDFLAGFSALMERGMTRGNERYLAALPEALAATRHVCASVNCASTQAGINGDAVLRLAEVLLKTARLTSEQDSIGCTRLVAFCNAVATNPFIAGAFHDANGPDAVVHVGISGPGVVLRAVRETGPEASFNAVSEAIKRVSFKITRAGELIGRHVAKQLSREAGVPVSFGVVDLSLAPTPEEEDSVGAVLQAMGLDDIGAPGTTAALALLTESMKKGGVMAASRVGGLSGAFVPVAEDQYLRRAVERGHLSLEKLEAMTAVCSVGLDMIAVPGNTPKETLAGIMLDEFAIGMMNGKTTACRLIPVHGKTAGDHVEWGGLLGRAPVLPVSAVSGKTFVCRGGSIPPPLHSLRN